jgi:hypothetical protein
MDRDQTEMHFCREAWLSVLNYHYEDDISYDEYVQCCNERGPDAADAMFAERAQSRRPESEAYERGEGPDAGRIRFIPHVRLDLLRWSLSQYCKLGHGCGWEMDGALHGVVWTCTAIAHVAAPLYATRHRLAPMPRCRAVSPRAAHATRSAIQARKDDRGARLQHGADLVGGAPVVSGIWSAQIRMTKALPATLTRILYYEDFLSAQEEIGGKDAVGWCARLARD